MAYESPDWTTALKLTILILFPFIFALISNHLKLSKIPGPKLYALTKWRLAYEDWRGRRTQTIHQLHLTHGPAIRVGPSELSFNSLTALKTIYGAGSGFERTSFYRMFDVYGKPNLFTFPGVKEHGERKKLLNHAYSKTMIFKNHARAIEGKAGKFLDLLEREPEVGREIFASLHYFSLDSITEFLYGGVHLKGKGGGATDAMGGVEADRRLLDDVLDPKRRKLAWFAVHFPRYTKWLMTRTGRWEKVVERWGLLPQPKPTVYTGIRRHALGAWEEFLKAGDEVKRELKEDAIIGKLWEHHDSKKEGGLDDMEIASEAADHLLAGVDTTADTLMFLIWALSRPFNIRLQEKLIKEVNSISEEGLNSEGIPTVEATSKLPYLNAVIMETLRLYAPLPASEPRSLPIATVIDGFHVPANTVVSMSPYTLHRNEEIFPKPYLFVPERWLGDSKEVLERKKWFWGFSSGGRMCIGIHLAMAEMTTLTAAIYRKYKTRPPGDQYKSVSPIITSRFETFFDETDNVGPEHECYIDFFEQAWY